MTKDQLIAFEAEIENLFLNKRIRAPIHLSSGNEEPLIHLFNNFYNKGDWIFSNWRNHYHVLLAGADPKWVKEQILSGNSMSMCCKDPKFISSSIVGGLVGQAVGTAWSLKQQKSPHKVICFLGDMTFETGSFHEAHKYAYNFELPIIFVVEDNGVSVGTPTQKTWGNPEQRVLANKKEGRIYQYDEYTLYYQYTNTKWPHVGIPTWVGF